MGHTAFSLSSRLSDAYVTQMLEKAHPNVLIHDRPVKLPDQDLKTIDMVEEQKLASAPQNALQDIACDPSVISGGDLVLILHSSGSTSLPKLLPFSNDQWMAKLRISAKVFDPAKREWPASAMYNTIGMTMLCRSLCKTAPIYFENDRTQLTPLGAVQFVQEAQPEEFTLTPHTLGLVASTEQGLAALKQANRVITTGAVCPDELGDMLTKEGIFLCNIYGMTESGMTLSSTHRPAGDTEWAWMLPQEFIKPWLNFRPVDAEAGLYTLVILPGCSEVLSSVKATDGCLYTNDVFLKHPSKTDRWKLIGRKDDQLKIYQRDRQTIVDAIQYEQKIKHGNEDIVDDGVVFGQGRDKLGVLVFAGGAYPGSDKAAEVTQRIWETLQGSINGKMKVGIDRNMIVVVDTKREALPQTGKFNLIRAQVYLRYQTLIDQAYKQPGELTADAYEETATGSHL